MKQLFADAHAKWLEIIDFFTPQLPPAIMEMEEFRNIYRI